MNTSNKSIKVIRFDIFYFCVFCGKVVMYLEDKESYHKLKEKIAGYTSFTWEETTERIIKALETI